MVSFKEYIEPRKKYLHSCWWQCKSLWRLLTTRPNTVILYTPLNFRNDYQPLLYNGLPKGCVALCMPPGTWKYFSFLKAKNLYYHQHWFGIDFLLSDQMKSKFLEDIRYFKEHNGHVIWTVHNTLSHDAIDEKAQVLFYRELAELVDYIHLHYEEAADIIRQYYPLPAHKIIVAPHGHYLDVIAPYEADTPAPAYESPIRFFAGGMLRPYKSFETLFDLFCEPDKTPANARLIVAGRDDTRVTVPRSDKIETHIEHDILSESEFFPIVRGSHFTILPYPRSLTSGMLLYSFSCGTPVLAPNYGHFKALINSSNGFLYDMDDKDGLAKAIRQACSLNPQSYRKMRQSAYETASAYHWTDTASLLFPKTA